MPRDIIEAVTSVLEDMRVDSRERGRSYLTAYQILEKLPSETRNRLIEERGTPGLGAGNYYAAANVVSDAAEMIRDIEIAFLETSSLNITLNSEIKITPGNPNIGLYRLQNHHG